MALSLAENFKFYFPDGDHSLKSHSVIHIGAVASIPLRELRMHKWDAARGAYFWYRALESTNDPNLRRMYYEKYGKRSSKDLLMEIPETVKPMFERNEFLSAVERIVSD
jgi:hypothetical protein